MTNHQITITTQSPISNRSITKRFGDWSIGYWLLCGVCYLVIGDDLLVAQTADSGSREAQRRRMAELDWTRDPFTRPAEAVQAQAVSLSLSGIIWDEHAPIAIINGQMLRVGQEFSGYRVVEIAQDHVSITDGTKTFQLSFAP